MDIQRLFNEHPASVGESYWGHLLHAAWFGGKMLLGAALVLSTPSSPSCSSGQAVRPSPQLHDAMVTHRRVKVLPVSTLRVPPAR